MNIFEKPIISECGCFHVGPDGNPLYEARFDEVLAFHKVGNRWIAPVKCGVEAFHIDTDGHPIYAQRFQRCFGFYHDLAAVVGDDGWYHIDQSGSELYLQRYEFAGNYQENVCVVMDAEGQYFHVNSRGEPVYDNRWRYCGDFRDGVAVVQAENGLSTHIRPDGSFLHDIWFSDLDVFHKGYARAKTSQGWFHVNKQGNAIYPERYASVEPFYNGYSRCETLNGALLVIDETGRIFRQLRGPTADRFSELSADMVGYWRTFTIYTGVKLGIFEQLPATVEQLAITCACNIDRLGRLMRALDEMGLIINDGGLFSVTEKGSYLCSGSKKTLADAAIEYGTDLFHRWTDLPELIRGKQRESDIFSLVADDSVRVVSHHRMLASYAQHDYEAVIPFLPINPGQRVLDAAGGTGTLASLIKTNYPAASVYLGDLASVVAESDYSHKLVIDLFHKWPEQYDIVVMARVLHDWDDEDSIRILRNAANSLADNGRIYLLEMLLKQDSSAGALCDLHLLAATGGRERTETDFSKLADEADFKVKEIVDLPSMVSLIILERRLRNG